MSLLSLLIIEEKWGDTYYHISTKEDLNKVALEILTERYNQGYWYEDDEDIYPNIEKAVAEKNGALAWRILRERSDKGYEYENVKLDTYQ